MAEDRASIDGATILDNIDSRQVEYEAEVGGDRHAFALKYAVLEALGGRQVGGSDDPVALLGRFRDEAERASARALARGPGAGGRIAVGEGDIA